MTTAEQPDPGTRPDSGPLRRRPDRSTIVLLLATLVGGCLIFWAVHEALVDDAYITLTYGRTLGLHGEWGLVPGYESNTATSPLNVLLLGALVFVVREPVVALGVLYVLSCVATAFGLRGLGRELGLGLRVAVIGTPLLLANPLLASTIGLETTLVVAAMAHLAWAAARRDPVHFGLVAGVLMWLRLDTAVIVIAMFVLTPALWRGWYRAVPLAAAVLLPWLLFSWVVLGSAIPDTLVIKQAGGFGNFVTGLSDRYAGRYPLAVLAVVVTAAVGALTALSWPWWRRLAPAGSSVVPALAAAAVAYFATIAVLKVPPFFWYYGPTVAALTICAAIGMARLVDAERSTVRRVGLAAAAGAGVLVALPWAHDLSEQAPLRAMPVHGNWAYPAEYKRIGTELGAEVGDTAVRSPGEVGGLIYHCECLLSDRFSERAQILDDIRKRTRGSWLMRLNYHFLDPEEVEPMGAELRLRWLPGPDPTGRGWNSHGLEGSSREHGHFRLVPFDPQRS
jgi:hypothetical protein